MATLSTAVAPGVADSPPAKAERLPRLRVGLFAASRLQARAIATAMARIAGSDFADIVVMAWQDREIPAPTWPWRFYRHLDGVLAGARMAAGIPVDLLSTVPCERVGPMPAVASESIEADLWRQELGKLNLDVAFVLGDIEQNMIAGVARYGIWRLEFPEQEPQWDGLEGFREVIEGRSLTSVSLRVSQIGQRELRLCPSWFRTVPFSITKNRDRLLRRAAQLPGRALQALHETQGASLAHAVPLPHLSLIRDDAQSGPGESLRGLARLGKKIGQRVFQKLFCVDQWFLAFRFSPPFRELPDLGEFCCLVPPKDRFWADPFPLVRDGRFYIFFEELIFARGKAHIAYVEIDRNGRCSEPRRVLECPYHLSYPFLIETEGQLFMVPETGQNGTVELYRCIRFPDRWRFEKVLLRAKYSADATFHHVDGTWWMFVNIGTDDTDIHDELHIFYADRLDGTWHPHGANPVKSDVRSARSAGRLYMRAGQLYRPAQIGVPIYGSGISINKVLKLTPTEYLEQEVARIVAPATDGILGFHTLNRAGELTVADGFIRRNRFGDKPPASFSPVFSDAAAATNLPYGPIPADGQTGG